MKKTNELTLVIEEQRVEPQTGMQIEQSFAPFFKQAQEWKEKAEAIVVTDESQTDLMEKAREARLALKNIRVDADKKRKALKEDSLRYGKAVQGVYNVIEFLIKPIEKHLEEQEKFVEIREQKEKERIAEERISKLEPYRGYVPMTINLMDMSEEDYQKLLNGAKFQYKAQKEAEEKAEKERLENERLEKLRNERELAVAPFSQFITESKDLATLSEKEYKAYLQELQKEKTAYDEEQEQIRKENEALKKQQEEARKKEEKERKTREEAERKEREIQEKKLKAEREAKEKAEEELRKQKEKEEAEERAKAEAEKKMKQAPDKEKLLTFAKTLDNLELPELKDQEMNKVLSNVKELITKTSNYIRENVK